jgi:hypothetical protein
MANIRNPFAVHVAQSFGLFAHPICDASAIPGSDVREALAVFIRWIDRLDEIASTVLIRTSNTDARYRCPTGPWRDRASACMAMHALRRPVMREDMFTSRGEQ